MSTLADELLNDFEEDNGSEDDGDHQNEFVQGSASPPGPNGHQRINGSMLVDDEEDEAEDEEMINGTNGMEDAQDEEETKAKVEKMQLGGVSDVRNVAGLMKTLEPVLEVRRSPSSPLPSSIQSSRFTSQMDIALTSASPPENRPLSILIRRTANNVRRLDRGQSRISPPHPVQHPLHLN